MGIEGLCFLVVVRGIVLCIDYDRMRMSTIPCSIINLGGEGVMIQGTCSSLREDEGVPIPFPVRGDVLFLLLHALKRLNRLLRRVVVEREGAYRGRLWN